MAEERRATRLALGCCFGMILGLEAASSGRPRPEGYDDVVFTS